MTVTATPSRLDRDLAVVAVVVVLGAVVTILDTTIVNVALDTLGRELGASVTAISWVTTGYLLALATVIPLTGWAADRLGARRVFIASLVLFVAGSALSAAAPRAAALIASGTLQGLGGGMLLPVAMTMLTRAAGPERVGRVMGIVFVPMLLGPVLGPVIGGWLVDGASWRWIFLVNLPVGVLALVLAARLLPSHGGHPGDPLDVRGLLLGSPGLALLLLGLAERSPAPLAAGAILLMAFVMHARRVTAPLVDVRLFARRAVAGSAGTMVL